MKVDVVFLSLIIGVFIPIIRGVVVKYESNVHVKTSVGVALSIIAGLISAAIENGGLVTKEAAISAFVAFITSQAAYYGIWQPTGAQDAVERKTANFGI